MRTRLLHWKKISLFLVLLALACPWTMIGQTTQVTDKFDIYDSQLDTVDSRIRLEIDRRAIKVMGSIGYEEYELQISGVRLYLLKGFEFSTLRKSTYQGSGSHYMTNFDIVKDDGAMSVYAPKNLSDFLYIYSCNSMNGDITLKQGYSFYVDGMKIGPIKEAQAYYNVANYYKPNSTTLEDGKLVMSEQVFFPEPIRIVGGGSPIVIQNLMFRKSNDDVSFNIDGGDVSLINRENLYDLFDINLLSGSLKVSDMEIETLTMKGGTLTLEGDKTYLHKVYASSGSIYYKNKNDRYTPYIREKYSNAPKIESNLFIDGDVTIHGEGKSHLTSFADIKNCNVSATTDINTPSCGGEKAYAFVRDSIVIDSSSSLAFNNVSFPYLKKMIIKGASNVEMNDVYLEQNNNQDRNDYVDKVIRLEDGSLLINKSELTRSSYSSKDEYKDEHVIEQIGGLLQIKNSQIGASILLNGEKAKAEFISGYATKYSNLEVRSGELDIKGGNIKDASVLMKGGSLNVSGGYFDHFINVSADCKITLSGGYYRYGIAYDEGVTIPASSSLLADGYEFGKNYINMIYPLGKDLKGKRYGFNTVTKDPMLETAAYKAAKTADVGPNGKDVKVNGTVLEIYTPQGLAWLAVATNDLFTNHLENGKEYFPGYNVTNTYKLMADISMAGYGENWPSINMYDDILDGQGYCVSDLESKSISPSFIDGISTDGVVANLIVKGNIQMTNQKYMTGSTHEVGGIVRNNSGRLVNCAFIGTMTSTAVTSISMGSLVGFNGKSGRIENCYVNPCGGMIEGFRHKTIKLDGFYPCIKEDYQVARLVGSNHGTVENCYFNGETKFTSDAEDNKNVNINNYEIFAGGTGNVINCYEGSDISVKTLNDNVQKHEQESDYPWATWAVNPDIQCGQPYLSSDSFPPIEDNVVIIDDDLPYEKTHQGKHVIVKSTGIYTIGEADASIISLTVEETGQVRTRKPLIITDSVVVLRQIDTDKWTTFCVPKGMEIANNLVSDISVGQKPIWSKVGYASPENQQWSDYGKDSLVRDTAYLVVARDESQMGRFYSKEGPFTLEVVTDSTATGNVVNGNWFSFQANPYWENLQIEGRAYILNDEGTSFELQENPVIPPFHCYMVASETIMSRVSSLRVSDLPTSITDVEESGSRVWTEGHTLCIENAEPQDIAVYSVNGALQARYNSSGTKRIALPQGVYLVICGEKVIKVVL